MDALRVARGVHLRHIAVIDDGHLVVVAALVSGIDAGRQRIEPVLIRIRGLLDLRLRGEVDAEKLDLADGIARLRGGTEAREQEKCGYQESYTVAAPPLGWRGWKGLKGFLLASPALPAFLA